jgi:dinuclear metal center YbgI/SA1388 family protein
MNAIEVGLYLDELLHVAGIPDVAFNGLQVTAKQPVQRIALAVDACLAVFQRAAMEKAQLIIAHHGLLWGKPFPLTGTHFERIKLLIDNDIGLYASHLPLDKHRPFGNNAQMIERLGFEIAGEFGEHNGLYLGYHANLPQLRPVEKIAEKVAAILEEPCRLMQFAEEKVSSIAVVSGRVGPSVFEEFARKKFGLLITGEPSHDLYHLIVENRLNVLYAGHYATETLGIKALGKHLSERFGIETIFIDSPTHL